MDIAQVDQAKASAVDHRHSAAVKVDKVDKVAAEAAAVATHPVGQVKYPELSRMYFLLPTDV